MEHARARMESKTRRFNGFGVLVTIARMKPSGPGAPKASLRWERNRQDGPRSTNDD
jgi:hypothetical protein